MKTSDTQHGSNPEKVVALKCLHKNKVVKFQLSMPEGYDVFESEIKVIDDKKDQPPTGKKTIPASEAPEKAVLNEHEAANYIGLSVFLLRHYRWNSKPSERHLTPRCIRVGKKSVRYLKKDLDAWLDQQPEI